MSNENGALLEKLKFELAFIEDGGYGRSVRTPYKSTSPFQDSLTCLNVGDPLRPHPCAECSDSVCPGTAQERTCPLSPYSA